MNNYLLQIVRFLIVGVIVLVCNITLLYVFTSLLGIWYLGSSVIAYVLAVILNFSLQKWWVFEHLTTGKIRQQFSLYGIVSLVYLALNTLSMYVLVDHFHVLYLYAQICITGVLSLLNFWVNRRFVFAQETKTYE